MLFSYQDDTPEKNLYWKVDTRFDSAAWKERVNWTIETNDVYDSDLEVEWIGENVAEGQLINISVWEDGKSKNNTRHLMLSPENWKQQLIAYLGKEKATDIILDFALKVSKQIWMDAKSVKKENEVVDKASKQFENNLKTGFYTPRKEEFKNTITKEPKMENKIPSGIEIEDEYEKGLTIRTTIHFIDEQSVIRAALDILQRKTPQILQTVIDYCVKYIDFDVEVESDFINMNRHYSYAPKSLPKTVGAAFYADLIKTFKFSKDSFDAFWKRISEDLTEEFSKVLRIAELQFKEKTEPKNYVPVKFPLKVGTFKGTITFQLLEHVYNLFINNQNVGVDDLFSKEANTLVKVEGTYTRFIAPHPKSLFGDWLASWDPYWDWLHDQEIDKKVNYETSVARDFKELIHMLRINIFEDIIRNSNELEIAMKYVKGSLLDLKKPQSKDTKENISELFDILEHSYLEANLLSKSSTLVTIKYEEASKNPYYNPTKLKQLKKELEEYKERHKKVGDQFYTALEKLKSTIR